MTIREIITVPNPLLKIISEPVKVIDDEVLSLIDKFNETVMFGLRTSRGISFVDIENDFGSIYKNQLIKNSQTHINNEFLIIKNNYLYITKKGKFLSDGIASDLFMLN